MLIKYFEQKEDFIEYEFNPLIKVDKNIENSLTKKSITEVSSKISVK
jgi:ribosomal protein L31E